MYGTHNIKNAKNCYVAVIYIWGGGDIKRIGRCGRVVVDMHVTSSRVPEDRESRAFSYFGYLRNVCEVMALLLGRAGNK